MDIQEIIEWFKAAKPNPTTDDIALQIGCHFEEIAEMQEALIHNTHLRNHIANYADKFKAKEQTAVRTVEFVKESQNRSTELLDALCDQIVTAIGVGYMMGFDMAGALDEVNKSNWSKFKDGVPVFDENGKIAKSDGYFKPDLAKFLNSNKEL